jgi:hypothetical protein
MKKAWTYGRNLIHLLDNGSKHLMLFDAESERHFGVVCWKRCNMSGLDDKIERLPDSTKIRWQKRPRTYLELFGVNFDACPGRDVAMKL